MAIIAITRLRAVCLWAHTLVITDTDSQLIRCSHRIRSAIQSRRSFAYSPRPLSLRDSVTEQRNVRRCYLQCSDCHSFVLYDTHSTRVTSRPGLCPACRSALNLRRFWKIGYVSRQECESRWTSQRPFDSPEAMISLQEPRVA